MKIVDKERPQLLPLQWVRGPLWDGVWIHSALWLAPIILWLCYGYDDPEDSPLVLLYFGLTALFWIVTSVVVGGAIGAALLAIVRSRSKAANL